MSLRNLSDELYHSGKIGMKWGVRRGPPYPIGSEKKSKAQQLNNLTSIAEAKRGRKFVEDILSKREG